MDVELAPSPRMAAASLGRRLLNKVPEVTLYFWIIKVLCTTVGETAADFLNERLGLGLTKTTYVIGGLLLIALAFQFMARKYGAAIYWLAVVLLSIVGTLITDNLTDNFGVSLVTTTVIFAIALAVTFAAWYAKEKTLSIHAIDTTAREAYYWLAILFTFALGTAAGDLVGEKFALGYLLSLIIFGALIAAATIAHYLFKLNGVLTFWIVYILTRPLGASLGDYLSQSHKDGGLNLSALGINAVFLATILGLVIFLMVTTRDVAVAENI